MITDRFNYGVDSGSRIQVTDPITGQTKVGYITGFPTESSYDYFDALWPNKLWDLYNSTATWANYLQKFIVGGTGFDYGYPALPIYVVEKEWLTWTTASLGTNDFTIAVENLVCADELSRCVVTTYRGTEPNVTSSIIYSDNGYQWYTSSFSTVTNTYERTLKDMVWSPGTNTFVGLGLSSSLREASPGYFVTDAKQYTVTSSNGIDWHFSIISASLNQNLFYDVIAWSPTYGKFVLYGNPGFSGLENYSASVYTSSTGVSGSWGLVSSHSFYAPYNYELNIWPQKSLWGIKQLVEYNGIIIGVGQSYYNTVTLITSSNLTNWTSIDTKHNSMYNIQYVPGKNKYFASGVSGSSYSTGKVTIATSSNLTDWGTITLDDRIGDDTGNFHSVNWSTDSSSSIALLNRAAYWLYSTSSNEYVYYRVDDKDTAYVAFEDELPATTLNTSLTPWTSSFNQYQYFDEDWNPPFNSDTAYTWIDFYLAIGPDYNANQDTYIPTSSYGIIIDSQSLAQFPNAYYDTFIEGVEVSGALYVQEISQNPGEEYPADHTAYYHTETQTVYNTATSSFSTALKANGRDYVYMYYGVSGNYMYETVALILNLNNGTIEYYEDSTNQDAPESYYMAYPTKLKFIEGPTLSERANDYWQLEFKVALDRGNRTRSGSLNIT